MKKQPARWLALTGALAMLLALPFSATADKHDPTAAKDRTAKKMVISLESFRNRFDRVSEKRDLKIGVLFPKDSIILKHIWSDTSLPGSDHITPNECIEITEVTPGDPNEYQVKWIHNVGSCQKSGVSPGSYTAIAEPPDTSSYRIDDVKYKVPGKHGSPQKHTVYFYANERVDNNDPTTLPREIDLWTMPGSTAGSGGSDPGHGRYR